MFVTVRSALDKPPVDPNFLVSGPAYYDSDGALNVRRPDAIRWLLVPETDSRSVVSQGKGELPFTPEDDVFNFPWSASLAPTGMHQTLMEIMQPSFTKAALASIQDHIAYQAQDVARELATADAGEFQVWDPAMTVAYSLAEKTLGVTLPTAETLRRWAEEFDRDWMSAENPGLRDYLENLVENGSPEPGSLWERTLRALREGKIDRPYARGMASGMITAILVPTATLLTNTMAVLGEKPEYRHSALEAIAAMNHGDKAGQLWLTRFIEEVLRWTVVFPKGPTTCTKEFELDGITVTKGTPIWLVFAAAGFDPSINGNNKGACSPDEFDPARHPNRHLSWAAGAHQCIGGMVTLLTVIEFVRAMLPALPNLQLLKLERLDPAMYPHPVTVMSRARMSWSDTP